MTRSCSMIRLFLPLVLASLAILRDIGLLDLICNLLCCDMGFGGIPTTKGQINPLVCLPSFLFGRWMDLNESRLLRHSREGLLLPHD